MNEVLLVADSIVSLPFPSVRPLAPVSIERVDEAIGVVVSYLIEGEEVEVKFRMNQLAKELSNILKEIKQRNGEVISIGA